MPVGKKFTAILTMLVILFAAFVIISSNENQPTQIIPQKIGLTQINLNGAAISSPQPLRPPSTDGVNAAQSITQLYIFDGEGNDDNFGYSVSGAGDVNNDGYADLIVGAWGYNGPAGYNAGRAYVFSGLTRNLLWTFDGEAEDDTFGRSVSGAGDVNNDGYADLIVGAHLNDGPGENAGRACVYSGRGIGCRTVSPAQCAIDLPADVLISAGFDIELDETNIFNSSVFVSGSQTGILSGGLGHNSPPPILSIAFFPINDFMPGEVITTTMTDVPTATSGYTLEPCACQFTTEAPKGSGTYDPHDQYAVADGPFMICTADFDNGGDLDLANSDYNSGDVFVNWNDGDGTFTPAVEAYNALGQARGICDADFNADGYPDLATADAGSDDVTVILNNAGDLENPTPVEYSVTYAPYSIAAGDLDNDGDLDLVTADAVSGCASGAVTILENNGAGGFRRQSYMPFNWCPLAITPADVNGDGILDVVVARNSVQKLRIIIGDGAARFSSYEEYSVGLWPTMVTTGDFDHDGDLDLACSNAGHDNVSIVLLDGVSSSVISNYPAGNSPFGLTSGDLNNDGAIDLADANYDVDSISVLLNIVPPCDCGVWGDVTGDDLVNPVDVVYMVNHVYKNQDARIQPPDCPFAAGDVNCDQAVNPLDVVYYVNYVYKVPVPFPCNGCD